MYWWSDIQFVPYKDNQIVTRVGTFVPQPGRGPLVANAYVHGMLVITNVEDTYISESLLS